MIETTLAEIRQIQAQNLLRIAEINGRNPAEIDPVLAEEILTGKVAVNGCPLAITVPLARSPYIPWRWLLAGLGIGLAGGVAVATMLS